MDLNKWNRSVGSFDKSAAEESDNRENKIDICKTSKNLNKAHDHDQQEQNNDINNENSDTNEDESKTATTIIISPLNRTLLKKPTTHKNVNNYNNVNDNNNNNKNNNLNSENSTCNINCSGNENDYQCTNNDYQFSKPITKNFKQQTHNHNFISKRAENTFVCPMLEKCASANFPNSGGTTSHAESDNEQEQEQEQESSQTQAQVQVQLQLQTQENQNDRPVDDVDATNKLSSRNAAHITGFETGVVGVCCGGISVGASVDFAAIGDSSNSSFILNLHKKQNLAVTPITTIATAAADTNTTTTTTNASSDHNSTSNSNSNTNDTSVTAKCHNCCNNNNNNNSNNSSNYCRN